MAQKSNITESFVNPISDFAEDVSSISSYQQKLEVATDEISTSGNSCLTEEIVGNSHTKRHSQ